VGKRKEESEETNANRERERDSCGANATKCIKLIIVAFRTVVVATIETNRYVYKNV